MAGNVPVDLLQRINEAERNRFSGLIQIVGNGLLVDIPVGLFTRDDSFALHALVAGLAALRTRSCRPSK